MSELPCNGRWRLATDPALGKLLVLALALSCIGWGPLEAADDIVLHLGNPSRAAMVGMGWIYTPWSADSLTFGEFRLIWVDEQGCVRPFEAKTERVNGTLKARGYEATTYPAAHELGGSLAVNVVFSGVQPGCVGDVGEEYLCGTGSGAVRRGCGHRPPLTEPKQLLLSPASGDTAIAVADLLCALARSGALRSREGRSSELVTAVARMSDASPRVSARLGQSLRPHTRNLYVVGEDSAAIGGAEFLTGPAAMTSAQAESPLQLVLVDITGGFGHESPPRAILYRCVNGVLDGTDGLLMVSNGRTELPVVSVSEGGTYNRLRQQIYETTAEESYDFLERLKHLRQEVQARHLQVGNRGACWSLYVSSLTVAHLLQHEEEARSGIASAIMSVPGSSAVFYVYSPGLAIRRLAGLQVVNLAYGETQ